MEPHFSWWQVPLDFLFAKWKISTPLGMVFTCMAVFCLATLFESTRVLVIIVHKRFFALPLTVIKDNSLSNLPTSMIEVPDSVKYVKTQRWKSHILQTLLHVGKVVVSYGLMLAIMTYNGYIAISIIFGASFGYYIFCHRIQTFVDPCPVQEAGILTRSTTADFSQSHSTTPSSQSLLQGEQSSSIA